MTTQETIEIVNEIIAELKAVTPAEEFSNALRMSMKALEMSKTLDEETREIAYSTYLQALADAVSL
jgi:hypothetical protein